MSPVVAEQRRRDFPGSIVVTMLFPLAHAVVVGCVEVEEASELDCPYVQDAAYILSKVHPKDDQVENGFWIYARA